MLMIIWWNTFSTHFIKRPTEANMFIRSCSLFAIFINCIFLLATPPTHGTIYIWCVTHIIFLWLPSLSKQVIWVLALMYRNVVAVHTVLSQLMYGASQSSDFDTANCVCVCFVCVVCPSYSSIWPAGSLWEQWAAILRIVWGIADDEHVWCH